MDDSTDWNAEHEYVAHLPFEQEEAASTQDDGVADKSGKDDWGAQMDAEDEEDVFYEDEGDDAKLGTNGPEDGSETKSKGHDAADKDNQAVSLAFPQATPMPRNTRPPVGSVKKNPVSLKRPGQTAPKEQQGGASKEQQGGAKLNQASAKGTSSLLTRSSPKAPGGSIVSRREDAYWLIGLAIIYFSLAIVCFIAFGIKGFKWYNSTSGTLTTVLALLGVSFSLMNKFTTTCLTTAYRREVGADLLSKKGLTLQNLLQFDQYVNRSTMSLLGNKGFRTITMPVGICIIIASAILKKSFELKMLTAPPFAALEKLNDFAVNDAPYFFQSNMTATTRPQIAKVNLVSNLTAPLLETIFNNSLFISQYEVATYTDDGIMTSPVPLNSSTNLQNRRYGTPALPDDVKKQSKNFNYIFVKDCPTVIASQTTAPSLQYLNTTEKEFSYGEGNELYSSGARARAVAYLYNNTFSLGYYEMALGTQQPLLSLEYGFQMLSTITNTKFISSGAGEFVSEGQKILLDNETVVINIEKNTIDTSRVVNLATDLIVGLREEWNLTNLWSVTPSDYARQAFEARFNGIAASLALVFLPSYNDANVQRYRLAGQSNVIKSQVQNTLIFGQDHYTLVLGLLLCGISGSIAIWAYKSIRKPTGFEFKLISAMSLVANAIDPNTELSQAITQTEKESQRQSELNRYPLQRPITTMRRRRATLDSSPRQGNSEKASAAIQARRRPMQTTPSRTQSIINPANIRLGLDLADRLIRLADDDPNI